MNNLIGISGKINSGKDLVGEILQYLACSSSKEQTFEQWRFIQGIAPYSEFKIKKFADKLKDIVCLLIGCTREQLENREFKEKELEEEWSIYNIIGPRYKDRQMIVLKSFTNYTDAKEFFDKNEIVYSSFKTPIDWSGYPQDTPYIQTVRLTPRLLLQLLGTDCGRKIIHPNIWVNALFADYKPIDNLVWQDPIAEYSYPKWIITDVRFPNEAEAIKQRGGILIRINRPCKECHGLGFHKMDCNVGRTEHESECSLDNYNDFNYVVENTGSIHDLLNKIENLNLFTNDKR